MAGKKRTADQPEERSGVAVSADTGLSTGDFTSPPGVSAGPQVVEQPGRPLLRMPSSASRAETLLRRLTRLCSQWPAPRERQVRTR